MTTLHPGSLTLRPVSLRLPPSAGFVEWLQIEGLLPLPALLAIRVKRKFPEQVFHLQAMNPPRRTFPHTAFRSSSPQGMRGRLLGSLLALRYSPRWRSRILLGVCSLTAITSPSLFKGHNESRAPSLSRHYPASSVLLAPPTSRPPGSDFGYPYTEPSRPSPATNEISRVTRCSFPRMPSRRPRRVHLLSVSVISTDGGGLPHLTTGSALSF